MLTITIDLYPHGRVKQKKTLSTMFITNDGTGTRDAGNYNVDIVHEDGDAPYIESGRVEGFPRMDKDAWDLVRKALVLIRQEENDAPS